MNFTPLGKRVLVEREEEKTTTASGIIIPDNAKEKPLMASVKAVSKELDCVSVGDKVMFAKYSGTELKLDGVDYLVLNIDDILGVVG